MTPRTQDGRWNTFAAPSPKLGWDTSLMDRLNRTCPTPSGSQKTITGTGLPKCNKTIGPSSVAEHRSRSSRDSALKAVTFNDGTISSVQADIHSPSGSIFSGQGTKAKLRENIMQSIPHGQKIFAKLDAVHGYFQLALDEESSYLTTFRLPQGRFRYLRAPMGLNASSDEWCRHSDVAVEGLDWCMKIVDDIIIWAKTHEEMWSRINIVLERCKSHNITISRKKLEIGEEIEFAGHVISRRGIKPDPSLSLIHI